jgi:DNA-binding NarL/FixJ family response regulator
VRNRSLTLTNGKKAMKTSRVFTEPAFALLTPREVEVLGWIAKGLTAKKIAQVLEISHHTVRTHRDNLKHKLGARSTAQLGYFHAALKIADDRAFAGQVIRERPAARDGFEI